MWLATALLHMECDSILERAQSLALECLHRDPSEDIYVIDDGSTDGTGAIAASFGAAVLRNSVDIGKAASVRRATAHFELTRRYDIVSMRDADTIVISKRSAKLLKTAPMWPLFVDA